MLTEDYKNFYYDKVKHQLTIGTVLSSDAPIVTAGTTKCMNLNSDMVDGKHDTDFSLSGHTHAAPSLAGAWPIGSVFLSVVSTDPATLLGFGTWARLGEGQFLAGFKTGDSNFGTVEATGGSLTAGNEASHTHAKGTLAADNHSSFSKSVTGSGSTLLYGPTTHAISGSTAAGSSHNHTILPPFVVVYVWKRTA
jgi:hypothetical protein